MAAPGAPTGVQATALRNVAIVTWQPPASDGGSAVTGYTVTASPGNLTVTVPAPNLRAVTVATDGTVLDNGTAYTFTVTAANGDGASPASSPSGAVTPNVLPGAMTNVYSAFVAQFWADGNYVETQFGGEFRFENSAPPRVVWIVENGPIVQSGDYGTGQIRDRHQPMTLLCWSQAATSGDAIRDDTANYGAAEALLQNVIASLNRVNKGSITYGPIKWAAANRSNLALGAVAALTINLHIPVTDYPRAMSNPIAAIPLTIGAQQQA